MLIEAVEFIKKTQTKRNELKLKLIQVNNKIDELKIIEKLSKTQKQDYLKIIDQKRLLIEEIASTDEDENENPATYTTNKITVRRSIDNTLVILRFL